ncbi:MAG: hypothetical protein J5621_01435 [Paludibacteraceae bacterium]|nr:hypothetical protein [Paludibacteraceae bacterium]
MKKIFLLLLVLPTMLMAQRKVAVFVTGNESLDPEVKEILGSELTSGIASSREFQAVESSASFAQVNSQDNQQLCELGQQMGVDLVCVANVTTFRDSYYIKSRLLDARSQAIVASASEGSPLAGIEDILNVCERLIGQLFYSAAPVEQEYSTVGAANKSNCDIISIDNTGANTIVTLKIIDAKGIRWSIYPSTVIRDRATGAEYHLISANGISTGASESYGVGLHEFSLTFEKLPYSATSIDIIEPKGWEWTDITLKNYGKTGFHQFVDETQHKFGRLMKEQEMMRRQEAEIGGPIKNITDSYRSYLITIYNERYSDFLIELNGKKLGTVAKRSQMTFRLAPEEYGLLKAIEISNFLPTVMKFDVPPTKPGEKISFNILRP